MPWWPMAIPSSTAIVLTSRATPVARSRARAPAMLRPWVTVRDRSGGMRDEAPSRPSALTRPLPGRDLNGSGHQPPPTGVAWASAMGDYGRDLAYVHDAA